MFSDPVWRVCLEGGYHGDRHSYRHRDAASRIPWCDSSRPIIEATLTGHCFYSLVGRTGGSKNINISSIRRRLLLWVVLAGEVKFMGLSQIILWMQFGDKYKKLHWYTGQNAFHTSAHYFSPWTSFLHTNEWWNQTLCKSIAMYDSTVSYFLSCMWLLHYYILKTRSSGHWVHNITQHNPNYLAYSPDTETFLQFLANDF